MLHRIPLHKIDKSEANPTDLWPGTFLLQLSGPWGTSLELSPRIVWKSLMAYFSVDLGRALWVLSGEGWGCFSQQNCSLQPAFWLVSLSGKLPASWPCLSGGTRRCGGASSVGSRTRCLQIWWRKGEIKRAILSKCIWLERWRKKRKGEEWQVTGK